MVHTFPNGRVYEGGFSDNKWNGYGVETVRGVYRWAGLVTLISYTSFLFHLILHVVEGSNAHDGSLHSIRRSYKKEGILL